MVAFFVVVCWLLLFVVVCCLLFVFRCLFSFGNCFKHMAVNACQGFTLMRMTTVFTSVSPRLAMTRHRVSESFGIDFTTVAAIVVVVVVAVVVVVVAIVVVYAAATQKHDHLVWIVVDKS